MDERNVFLKTNTKIGYLSIETTFEMLDFETKFNVTNKIKRVLITEFIPLFNSTYFVSNLFESLTQSLLKASSFNNSEIEIIETLSKYDYKILNELVSIETDASLKFQFNFSINNWNNSEKFHIQLFDIKLDNTELSLNYRFNLMEFLDSLSDEEPICSNLCRIDKKLMFVF